MCMWRYRWRSHRAENTRCYPTSAVEQLKAWLMPRWEAASEVREVLSAFSVSANITHWV